MALDASTTVGARRTRHALRGLLLARGVTELELRRRNEMEGIRGKLASRGLDALAAAALASRQLPPATKQEIAVATERSHGAFEALRRLSLVEVVHGELLELLVVLDRALCLREAGLKVSIGKAFSTKASSRNLVLTAMPETSLDVGLKSESIGAGFEL